jgi:hypothetical protein
MAKWQLILPMGKKDKVMPKKGTVQEESSRGEQDNCGKVGSMDTSGGGT